ncbi:MAG: PIN domain-containing protein [Bacteroidota bacterium]|nr:PIN domain-containing protein [Bacteroidota bacterium]
MQRIFIDANIIIDWLNSDSKENELCTQCISTIISLYNRPYVSPTTVAIVFYMVGKFYKDKKHIKKVLLKAFSYFMISIEDQSIVEAAFESKFIDIEDGIQYFSAMRMKADAIITFNRKDFIDVKIPILHPSEFLQLHSFENN